MNVDWIIKNPIDDHPYEKEKKVKKIVMTAWLDH